MPGVSVMSMSGDVKGSVMSMHGYVHVQLCLCPVKSMSGNVYVW